jgi:hypothetical protein
MLRILLATALLGVIHSSANAQETSSCAAFQKTVQSTYNFRPASLVNDKERNRKSAAMDQFWEDVKAKKNELLPCLRQALQENTADRWFLFDGSNLLVSLDPSDDSKRLQIKNYAVANLDDVDLAIWIPTLARLGSQGFDVSAPGERWLAYPKATYYLPQHAAQVDKLLGGIFIFGSMNEVQATPALLKIAASPEHPGREQAISLLLMQATPEAIDGLKQLDQSTLSSEARSRLRMHLTHPILFEPRAKPKTSREEFLKAFNDAAKGDWKYFLQLVDDVPDGEKDVVATMKTEDLPLIRKVRRLMIARANPHAADYYVSFTQILMTLTWRPEMAK